MLFRHHISNKKKNIFSHFWEGGGAEPEWENSHFFLTLPFSGTLNILSIKNLSSSNKPLKCLFFRFMAYSFTQGLQNSNFRNFNFAKFYGSSKYFVLFAWLIVIRSDGCWLFSTKFLLAYNSFYIQSHWACFFGIFQIFRIYSCMFVFVAVPTRADQSVNTKHFLVCS